MLRWFEVSCTAVPVQQCEASGRPEVLLDDLEGTFVCPDVLVGRTETTKMLQVLEVMGKPILATALDRFGEALALSVHPKVGAAHRNFERDGATALVNWPRRPGVFFVNMASWVGLILTRFHVVPEVDSGLSAALVRDLNIPFFLIIAKVQVADSGGQWRWLSTTSDDLATSNVGRLVDAQ